MRPRFGESRRRVARVAKRRLPGVMPPLEEHARHLRDAKAGRAESQPQVVILGPRDVAPPADVVERVTPKHHRRMTERRLDEEIARVVFGRDEGVLPCDVSSEARADRTIRRERFDARADRAEPSVRREERELVGEATGQRDVVRVHPRNEVAPRDRTRARQCAHDPAGPRVAHEPDARVLVRDRTHALHATVGRIVVHRDHLERHVSLREHARERVFDRALGVAKRHEHTDERRPIALAHGVTSIAPRTTAVQL
jgi:hypothetical protein